MSKLYVVALLIWCIPLRAQIVINELAPSNNGIIVDEYNDYSDWIELYNDGINPVSLLGYGITDDTVIGKWKFPDVTISAGSFLTVFASDKNNPDSNTNVPFPNHWETAINDYDTWKYVVPSTDLPSNWNTVNFDDSGWSQGNGGFGYGDNDDVTIILDGSISVYCRKIFSVADKSKLVQGDLSIDYDDGFVAYLNGIEIARKGLSGYPPAYDDYATTSTEAQLYQGLKPAAYTVDYNDLQSILVNGDNVLAVEVHNKPDTSSDLTCRPFFHFGILDNSILYSSNPSWFINPDGNLHTNFKLSIGETIQLSNNSGVVIDSQVISDLPFGAVNARIPDGSANWCMSSSPTFGSSNNNTSCATAIMDDPQFSLEAGFYNGIQTVSLTTLQLGAVIRYTTNGDIPDESSAVYINPIEIDSTTVIRARCFGSSEFLPSNTVTNTYFINDDFSLPVISLITDSLNLWDYNSGIYVLGPSVEPFPNFDANFWKDWEKEAFIEYFDTTHQEAFKQRIGLQIDGGWTRGFPQKGFQVKAGKGAFGEGDIDYSLIEDKPYLDSYASLYLRCGFQEVNAPIDAFLERLLKNTSANSTGYSPVIVFLNGKYWGIYELREKEDGYYFQNNFGVDHDSIDILSASSNPDYFLTLHATQGSIQDFYDSFNFITDGDPEDSLFYDNCNERVDLKNFTDYIIGETWANNKDWIPYETNNIKIWHWQNPEGKWRYVFHDMDASCTDSLSNILHDLLNTSDRSALMLVALLANEEFRNYFIDRYADLMNTTFQPDQFNPLLNDMINQIYPEWENYFKRWQYGDPSHVFSNVLSNLGDTSALLAVKNSLIDFADARTDIVRNQIVDEFDLNGEVNITLNADPPDAGHIQISTIIPDSLPWSGIYFNGVPVTLTAIPESGYYFSHWTSNPFISDTLNSIFTNNIISDESFTANFNSFLSGVSDIKNDDLEILPNPADNFLIIRNPFDAGSNVSYSIHDLSGRRISQGKYSSFIDISNLSQGMYIIFLFDSDNHSLKGKFIRQ